LNDYEKLDKARAEREKALHSLESTVFDYTNKLEEEDFKRFGTNEELESISKALAELREWLEEIPNEIAASDLKEKRRELMKPIRKLKNRQQQKEVVTFFSYFFILNLLPGAS
jgi:molecular chaperone DnaK (HSP70)